MLLASAILSQYTRVTDRHTTTDIWHKPNCAMILQSSAKNNITLIQRDTKDHTIFNVGSTLMDCASFESFKAAKHHQFYISYVKFNCSWLLLFLWLTEFNHTGMWIMDVKWLLVNWFRIWTTGVTGSDYQGAKFTWYLFIYLFIYLLKVHMTSGI